MSRTPTRSWSAATAAFTRASPKIFASRARPWQGQHRGEMANLATQYVLDIEEPGYAAVGARQPCSRQIREKSPAGAVQAGLPISRLNVAIAGYSTRYRRPSSPDPSPDRS